LERAVEGLVPAGSVKLHKGGRPRKDIILAGGLYGKSRLRSRNNEASKGGKRGAGGTVAS